MEKKYSLEWLDILIMEFLNPSNYMSVDLDSSLLQVLEKRLAAEKNRQMTFVKNEVFDMGDEFKIQLFVNNYYSALKVLLDHVDRNIESTYVEYRNLLSINGDITKAICDLLSFVSEWFGQYLATDRPVPNSFLKNAQNYTAGKFFEVKQKFKNQSVLAELIWSELEAILVSSENVSFRSVNYVKLVVDQLIKADGDYESDAVLTELDKYLIFLNFNSRTYFDHLTEKIADFANQFHDATDKLENLFLCYKRFNQLLVKDGVGLTSENGHLKTILGNWFSQEIIFIEKKLHTTVLPNVKAFDQERQSQKSVLPKVLCVLSVDQISIVLRAADEMKLLVAKSMTAVFNMIAPHLSTPYKEEISPGSMRNKAYNPEERDKQVAIDALKRMIAKIESY